MAVLIVETEGPFTIITTDLTGESCVPAVDDEPFPAPCTETVALPEKDGSQVINPVPSIVPAPDGDIDQVNPLIPLGAVKPADVMDEPVVICVVPFPWQREDADRSCISG